MIKTFCKHFLLNNFLPLTGSRNHPFVELTVSIRNMASTERSQQGTGEGASESASVCGAV